MAEVTRGFYRRWYGLAEDIAKLTPGSPEEDTNKTAILRITDMYFSTDTGELFWWVGDQWVAFGDSPNPY